MTALKDITIQLADWAEYLSVLTAVLSFLTFKRKGFFSLLTIYLLVLSVLNIASKVTADFKIHNAYLYHLIGAFDLSFIYLLHRKLGLKAIWNWFFLLVAAVYLIDSLALVLRGADRINSYGQSLCMLFILVLGFNFLWKLYQEEKVDRLERYSYFYINAAFTLFASGAFFGYLLIARITDEEIPAENFYYSWLIISGFAYLKFILISIGILVERKYAK